MSGSFGDVEALQRASSEFGMPRMCTYLVFKILDLHLLIQLSLALPGKGAESAFQIM